MLELSQFALQELHQLKTDLEHEIKRRRQEEKLQILATMQKLAAERGFDLDELIVNDLAFRRTNRRRSMARYKNPLDAQQVWSGRGRKPDWLKRFLANGGDINELRT